MGGVNDAGLPCDGRLTNAEEAMELLKAVGRRSWKSEGDIVTVRSVICNLTDCSATRVGNKHYGEESCTRRMTVAS